MVRELSSIPTEVREITKPRYDNATSSFSSSVIDATQTEKSTSNVNNVDRTKHASLLTTTCDKVGILATYISATACFNLFKIISQQLFYYD